MAKTAFGYIGKTLLSATGMKLANMAIAPVFNLIFGVDDDPSNQDVKDDIDKQAAEIKAMVNEVLAEVQTLSEKANQYHSEEMRQLQMIDSNISTLEFRKQTDKIAEDYANVLKRITQHKDNFTCDGMGKLNNTTYKAYKEIISDPVCNVSNLQADFDAMLSFLKGERSSNNHENGYQQLTSYLLDRVIAADKNEHSYTNTPDYHKVIKGINAEITSMEEHAILDFFAINVLNNMAKKVKEYEIDNNIITVNADEAPYTKYENTASEMLQSLGTMDGIFTKVIEDNNKKILDVAPYTLRTTNLNKYTAEKGCRSFIDAWSQGVDSRCDFTIDSNGRFITVKADAKKGYKLDDNVKGINPSGGFEVPERRKVELNLGRDNSNGSTFDSTAKSDLNTFSVSSNSDFTLTYTFVKGGCHAIYVPGNAENAIIYHNRGTVYATTGSAICIDSGAKNTNATIIGDYNYDCAGGFEDKGSNTTTGYIIFSKIDPPSREPDWYT
ncbi:MAG: hypothetical protein IJI50_07840 [Ruminococcus sp.]|nr:hypothetical protein [Ruminococcus sp.]